ncbi:MAG: hypothetical protein ACKVW3_07740 [Phycisphaerales bacterium]
MSVATPAQPSPTPRAEAAILALAAVLRLAWAALVPIDPISDCKAYDIFARNLAAGHAFGFEIDKPSAFWPPGTSFLYSLVYRLAPPEHGGYALAAGLNLLFGVGIVAASMALTRAWFGRRASLIAGTLLALWPFHVQFTSILASELPFTFFCLLGLLAWSSGGRPWVRVILTALAFAAATLIRPTALLLPVVLVMVSALRGHGVLGPGLRAAAVLAVMGLCLAPWSVRNTRLFGQFVLVSANGGSNLWMGNNSQTTGYYQELPKLDRELNEAQVDAELGRRAKAHIREQPAAFVARTFKKAVLLHRSETIGVGWNERGLARAAPSLFGEGSRGIWLLKAASTAYWWLVLALALLGLAWLARARGIWHTLTHPAAAFWAYFTAVHAVIVIQDRYHFPATPLIAALASVPISGLIASRLAARQPSPPLETSP